MKFIKRLILLLFISALAAGGWYLNQGNEEEPTSFRTEEVTRGDIKTVVSATGTLSPVTLITVGSQVSGKVEKIHVRANDYVKAGQLLAEIDPALTLAQLKQDQANMETVRASFEQAQRDLERTRMLVARDYVAKIDLERAEQSFLSARNNYESARTVIERDKLNLNYTKITAPIDGIIISQTVTEGQTLQASFQSPELFKIVGDLTKMEIAANFYEADINNIKTGMPVSFTVNAFDDREFSGTVRTVNLNPRGTSQGVTYSVTIDVENQDAKLLPGMTASVSVILSVKKDILRIPATALRFKPRIVEASGLSKFLGTAPDSPAATGKAPPGSKTIYLIRNDKVTPVVVVTGVADEALVEVSGEGIAEGDTVITGIKKVRRQ